MTVEPYILHDSVGITSTRPRLTHIPSGDTLVAQPYMTQEFWDRRCFEFYERHPDLEIRAENNAVLGTTAEGVQQMQAAYPDLAEPISQEDIDRLELDSPENAGPFGWVQGEVHCTVMQRGSLSSHGVFKTPRGAAREARRRNALRAQATG